MNMNEPKPPEKVFRAGRARASIWMNEVERDGKTVPERKTKVEKTYQDPKTKEYKTTSYFYPSELADLELVTRKAYEYIRLREFDGATQDATAVAADPTTETEETPF